MADASVRYSLLAGTAVACRILGVPPERMLTDAGLSLDIQAHETVGVSAPEFYRAWEALVALAPQANAPLALGQALARGPFIPAMFALTCAPDLVEGLARLVPYKTLIGPSAWTLTQRDDEVEVGFESVDPEASMPASMAAMQVALVLDSLRTCTAVEVVPRRVQLSDAAALGDWLGVEPEPGPRACLVLSHQDAHRPFVSENAGLWSLFQHDLDLRMERRDVQRPLVDRVRTALRKGLAGGQASLHHVGEDLGMSVRSVQAGLSEEGSSYQELLAQVRRDLALRYLQASRLRNEEIAYMLGYQDPNSFYRAFRDWTGMTPTEARERG